MNWIDYLLEANLYMVLFYAVYYLLLRRDTHYQLNRIYLMGSTLLAFIIPVMKVGILKPPTIVTQATQVNIPYPQVLNAITITHPIETPTIAINYYILVYVMCALIMTAAFCIRIYQLVKMARRGNKILDTDYRVIEIEDDDRAFSFFNYLFISKKLTTSATIIQHELVHIRQKHSLDIMYFELVKIICWFNPVVYLMQGSIKELHEFIADNHIAASQHDVNHYTDFLISNAYGLPEMAITNNFFNKNLLKNRIMMLHQKRSGSLARLKYLVALPLLAGMLCLSTLGFTKDYSFIDLAPAKAKQIPPPPPPVIRPDKPQMPPPPPTLIATTKKGYRFKQEGYVTNGKTDFKVSITEKSGEVKEYSRSKLAPADLRMLSEKYGYTFPQAQTQVKFPPPVVVPDGTPRKPKIVDQVRLPPPGVKADVTPRKPKVVDQVRLPPPVVVPDGTPRKPKIVDQVRLPPPGVTPPKPKVDQVRFPPPVVVPDKPVYDTTSRATTFQEFYKQLSRNIHYPTEAFENLQHGKVFVIFNVDENNKPYNFFIARGLSAAANAEVLRVLAGCTLPATVRKDGSYMLPISFNIRDKNGKWVDDKNYSYVDLHPAVNNDYKKPTDKTIFTLNEVVIAAYSSK